MRSRPAWTILQRWLVPALLVAELSLGACGTQPPGWLKPVFEDPPANDTRTAANTAHRPRRPHYTPPAPVEEVKVEEIVLPDWGGIYRSLARDDQGQVLWVKALEDKQISPRPGIAEDAKDEEPTDLDVELVPKGQPQFKSVFSHKVHTAWMACTSCHTALFEMEHGKTVITMEKINAGTSCGTCHGKVAAPEPSACPACHSEMNK